MTKQCSGMSGSGMLSTCLIGKFETACVGLESAVVVELVDVLVKGCGISGSKALFQL